MKEKNGPTHDGKERRRNSKDFLCVVTEKEGNGEVEVHCSISNAENGVCRVWHRQGSTR